MTTCPLCEFANIEGADLCEQCGQPLDDAHELLAKNAVEHGLLVDVIDSLSPKTPVVVDATTSVKDVLGLLVSQKIGCVFIHQDDAIVGVFSERDALIRVGAEVSKLADEPISKFMTRNPQSLPNNARIAFAVHRMDVGGFRHVPIVDGESRAIGVISVRDILRYLAEKIAVASG